MALLAIVSVMAVTSDETIVPEDLHWDIVYLIISSFHQRVDLMMIYWRFGINM